MICVCGYNNQFNDSLQCAYCGIEVKKDNDHKSISILLKDMFEFDTVETDSEGEIGIGRPDNWLCKPKKQLPYFKMRDLILEHGIILLSAWEDYYIFIRDEDTRKFI